MSIGMDPVVRGKMVQKSGATVNKWAGRGKIEWKKRHEALVYFIQVPIYCMPTLSLVAAHILCVSYIYLLSFSFTWCWMRRDEKFAQQTFLNFNAMRYAMAMKKKLNEMKRCDAMQGEAKRNEKLSIATQYKQWPSKMSNRCVCAYLCNAWKRNLNMQNAIGVATDIQILFKSSTVFEERTKIRETWKIIIINEMK